MPEEGAVRCVCVCVCVCACMRDLKLFHFSFPGPSLLLCLNRSKIIGLCLSVCLSVSSLIGCRAACAELKRPICCKIEIFFYDNLTFNKTTIWLISCAFQNVSVRPELVSRCQIHSPSSWTKCVQLNKVPVWYYLAERWRARHSMALFENTNLRLCWNLLGRVNSCF